MKLSFLETLIPPFPLRTNEHYLFISFWASQTFSDTLSPRMNERERRQKQNKSIRIFLSQAIENANEFSIFSSRLEFMWKKITEKSGRTFLCAWKDRWRGHWPTARRGLTLIYTESGRIESSRVELSSTSMSNLSVVVTALSTRWMIKSLFRRRCNEVRSEESQEWKWRTEEKWLIH